MNKKNLLLFVCILLTVTLFVRCEKDEEEPEVTLEEYSLKFKSTVTALEAFIMAAQAYESANYDLLTTEEKLVLINGFITSGEHLLETIEEYANTKQPTKSFAVPTKSSQTSPCAMFEAIPGTESGLSVAFMYNIGKLIAETRGERDELQRMLDNGLIDDDTFDEALTELARRQTVKSANFGFSAILGTGAAGLAGAAIWSVGGVGLAMTAPAVIGVTVVGAAVGTTYYMVSNWWHDLDKDENLLHNVVVARGEIGDPIPTTILKDGANTTLFVEGYSPVFIPSIDLPAKGNHKTFEIKPVPLQLSSINTEVEICTLEEPFIATTCEDILYVTAHPTPPDPAPFEGVTVTATIFPPIAGCEITFHIVGTDGYEDTDIEYSNADGQANFFIPGGAEGVFDIVTITTSAGHTFTVTYTF